MMHDNLDPEAASTPDPSNSREGDREVPVADAHVPPVVQAWLDGEPVDEKALRAAGSYELWRQVQAEAARRRRMHTPTPIAGAIMKAIQKDG